MNKTLWLWIGIGIIALAITAYVSFAPALNPVALTPVQLSAVAVAIGELPENVVAQPIQQIGYNNPSSQVVPFEITSNHHALRIKQPDGTYVTKIMSNEKYNSLIGIVQPVIEPEPMIEP